MDKLVITLIAGAVALGISGSVLAVDTHRTQQPDPDQSPEPIQHEQVPARPQGAAENAQPLVGSDGNTENPEYAAALKKCESMTGARRAACADAARTKFGQM